MMVVNQLFEPLALVGMDAAWAGVDGLDAFERMTYEMGQHFAHLDSASAGPSPDLQRSLLGRTARRAMEDAGQGLEKVKKLRIVTIVAGAASEIVDLPWAGRVIDLSGENNPLAAAVMQAQRLLTSSEAEMVIFAAAAGLPDRPADLPLAAEWSSAFGFDRDIHGWRLGEGAGAVVWMLNSRAEQEGRRVYALIRSIAIVPGKVSPAGDGPLLPVPPTLDETHGCIRAALERAGAQPDQIGYIEAFASGSDTLDGIEVAGLAKAYRQPEQDLRTAIGSVQGSAGYLGASAGLAGLVRAALCLYQRMIPGAPGWSAPKLPALWRGTPFYIPSESRAWFASRQGPGRLAALNTFGLNGSFAHLILAEGQSQELHPNRALAQGGFFLFPLAGDSLPVLLNELRDLKQAVTTATNLANLAAECYSAAQTNEGAPYALAVVGHDAEELQREIDYALNAIPTAFEKKTDWQTPLGSYFTADPVGTQGGVAFVYPGAFNSYPGVGKDLFRLFPNLHNSTQAITVDLGRVIRERMLYPRSLAAISKEEMAGLEAKLLADPIAMLISGATLAILYTHILQDEFKIQPSAAFGYSLGENSMLFATGVWQQGDQASARLESSLAFRQRLAGPQLAIREHWGLPANSPVTAEPLWNNYLVMSTPEKVQAALAKEPHVYLTHINTPRQVVIGGDPQGCKRVLADLRCASIQAPFDYALHCEVMRSEYEELAYLHRWPVEQRPAARMYSAADYGPLEVDEAVVAQKIAHMLTTPLDFPRLVRQVYADGARVFIEAGAGGNCARWVDESLKGSPHLALSMDRRGTDDYSTLVRTLARLFSHRVPLDLSALYQPASEKVSL